MKPLCSICGDRHESYQAHVFATNANATNKIPATNAKAGASAVPAVEAEAVVVEKIPVRTLNRRARESYNAYQREYMRKRRAK